MMNRIKRHWYDAMEPALPLAWFRIGYAALLLAEIVQMALFRDLIFREDSLAGRHPGLLTALLIVWAASLLLMLVGYRLRIAAIVNYAVCVYMLGRATVSETNNWQVDSLFLTGALLLVFIPASLNLSVDSLMERRRQARIRVRKLPVPRARRLHSGFLMLLIGLFYWDSVLYKISSDMYLTGLGLWAPASLPFAVFYDVSWLIDHSLWVRALGYGTILYEALYLVLVPWRKLRTAVSLVGIALHAGVLAVFPIPVMSLLVIVIHLSVIPGEAYARVYDRLIAARRKSLTVYYDRLCPLCRQTVGILSALDVRKAIEWRALQDFAAGEPLLSDIPEADLLHDIYAVEKNRHLRKGVDTYAAILRHAGWSWPLGKLLELPPAHGIAARVYAVVAARRKREGGCTDNTCGIGIAPPAQGRAWPLAGKAWPAGAAAGLWLLSFAVLSLGTPFYERYVTGRDTAATSKLRDVAAVFKSVSYPVFGLSNHGVYTETHFEHYTFETRLVYKPEAAGDGPAVALPILDDSGYAGRYLVGRQWDHWAYATVDPDQPYRQAAEGMIAYAEHWISHGKRGLTADGGYMEVQAKPLEVSMDEFRSGLLRRNAGTAWRAVGAIRRGPDGRLSLTTNRSGAKEPETWREAVESALAQ